MNIRHTAHPGFARRDPKDRPAELSPPTTPPKAPALTDESLPAHLVGKEAERLAALDDYDILDTPRDEAFDHIVRLAKTIFDVPMAAITIIDGHRQWFKAAEGIDQIPQPREDAFCRHALHAVGPLVIDDAAADARFASNPMVIGAPSIRAYAGVQLRSPDGHTIGTLCAMDTKPRQFDERQLLILSELRDLAMCELELRRRAARDVLTGALSRRSFREQAERAIVLAQRHHQQLSLIELDLDRFKTINDEHGHAGGDAVLAATITVAETIVRRTDMIGRLGGDEFAILLPGSDRDAALLVGEKIRLAINDLRVPFGETVLSVGASVGVAALSPSVHDLPGLLARADAALYKAKQGGRDQVVAFRTTDTGPPRRRVLKAGVILFNNRNSTMECTVRSLWDNGAGLEVYNAAALPKAFELLIRSEGLERQCRIVSHSERQIDVEFVKGAGIIT